MTFGMAVGYVLTTLFAAVFFATVGDMIGWNVLGLGFTIAVAVVVTAFLLARYLPPAPRPVDDEREDP